MKSIKIGDIILSKSPLARYRILSIIDDYLVLCRLDTSKFDLMEITKTALMDMVSKELIIIEEANNNTVFNIDALSESCKENYWFKLRIMKEVLKIYGPDYLRLCGRKTKKELDQILKKYSISRKKFWRICVSFFQSAFDNQSLVDGRYRGNSTGKEYSFNKKNGRVGDFGTTGIPLTKEVIENFEEALKEYTSGRHKSIKSCYDHMNYLHYMKTEIIGGRQTIHLMAQNERPTLKQFSYYISKHISKEEKDIIKTSQMEFRNNQRLLTSDSLYGVAGPGDLVEIDACEADVSLVSMTDSKQTIGRPIVYFMMDVYSRVVLAASIAFDNNSLLGISNLLLNLCDDKKEYCKRYGVLFEDERIWPSNIIPNRLRVDRGAEVKSKEFGRICNALGIQKDIVSGGSGSLKGVVEQSFHQMHIAQNEYLEDHGLIEKRHDSNHHKEATLNIEQYTKMVINFVLTHNQKYLETYPLTKRMIDEKVPAIPAKLWQYGIEKEVTPRPIINKMQYLYELMTPIKVSVSRRGISYKGLYYFSNDAYITTLMFKAQNKKIPLEARMDMRNISMIYILQGTRLIQIPLNERLAGNGDYKEMTMKQYEDYRKERRKMNASGKIHNEQLSVYSSILNKSIVAEAASQAQYKSKDKNMRLAREMEKQRVSKENEIAERFEIESENNDNTDDISDVEESKETEELTDNKLITPEGDKNLTEEELMEKRKKALRLFEEEDW